MIFLLKKIHNTPSYDIVYSITSFLNLEKSSLIQKMEKNDETKVKHGVVLQE